MSLLLDGGSRATVRVGAFNARRGREGVAVGRLDAELAGGIRRAVDARRADTVRLLQDLVRVPSVTGEEGAVQEVVERAFRARGLAVDRWEATPEEASSYADYVGEQKTYSGRPNVVGVRAGRGGGRSILLNAHVDTVASGDRGAWSRDPFTGEIEGDLLYGRGSCDMKGGLVTHLAALDALEGLGIELRGDVSVAATVGEENGGLGALSTVLRGYRADAANFSSSSPSLRCEIGRSCRIFVRQKTHRTGGHHDSRSLRSHKPLRDGSQT